ncbi:MAG: DegT/DnrJ/EryC1/StrS family aminotransferase [Deltaproteobacteria bacterium]|nr:DegT/DnrJ/EryC1/StrS family aminotransferase [Deltaproteobacteria bacterium]
MKKIEFYQHNITSKDIKRASDVLKSIFLTTGDEVYEFEKKFSSYLSINNTIGLTSCTAALHLALLAWDIGTGDEVITTPLSFCATSNSVIHAGAKPVFVDVEEDTGNINAELIEDAITERTKAIMPVHLYGQMCDMKSISQIADKYNLVVIEDAAHCIEGSRNDIRVGQLGDAACFSFYATKNITSGEGGAISTNNNEKSDLLKMMRTHGIDKSAADRYTKKYRHWDMPVLGWKYNMDNIHASLLIGQLQKIDELHEKREQLWSYYVDRLSSVKGIRLLKDMPDSVHARHLFTALVAPDRRDSILWQIQDNGIGVAVNYRAIHLLEYYRRTYGYKEGDFPVAEDIGNRTISLPLYPKLSRKNIKFIAQTFAAIL